MALIEDWTVYPTMVKLAACLCEEMDRSGFGPLCFCGIIPGAEAVVDFCGNDGRDCDEDGACGGMAWVRLVAGFPSDDLLGPSEDATCATPMAFELEVGSTQCAPSPDSDGTPPGLEEQLAATRRQLAAMAAMRRAIACCMAIDDDLDYLLGSYEPIPVLGGCLGGVWTVTVGQPHG